jgi:uncharacterized protein YndB with AHSA1/START domain
VCRLPCSANSFLSLAVLCLVAGDAGPASGGLFSLRVGEQLTIGPGLHMAGGHSPYYFPTHHGGENGYQAGVLIPALRGVMIESSESVMIGRPASEVFAYVADLRNEPRWHVDIASVPSETDPVPVVGKTYALKFKPFLGKTDGTFTALEVEPGARVVYRADFAGLQPRITYTVDPAGAGSRFTRAVQMRPTGLKVLMTPMMTFMVPRRNKVFVQNLKRALES